MSSNNPNLQNLPSNSVFGKLIKQCFSTKKGWLMVGADFSSLEDRINALLTKDSNKLKVYTDGYDGHSLRAYYYWKDQMPEINHKMSRLNESGKFYKVTINGKTEYYHESDMPEDIKRNLGI